METCEEKPTRKTLKAFAWDLVTDKCGHPDEMALLAIASFTSYVGIGGYDIIVNGRVFDAQGWGVGLAAIVGGIAAGMGMKSKGEFTDVRS